LENRDRDVIVVERDQDFKDLSFPGDVLRDHWVQVREADGDAVDGEASLDEGIGLSPRGKS
jgi:hypothetical protein